jgi:hypothetical protein
MRYSRKNQGLSVWAIIFSAKANSQQDFVSMQINSSSYRANPKFGMLPQKNSSLTRKLSENSLSSLRYLRDNGHPQSFLRTNSRQATTDYVNQYRSNRSQTLPYTEGNVGEGVQQVIREPYYVSKRTSSQDGGYIVTASHSSPQKYNISRTGQDPTAHLTTAQLLEATLRRGKALNAEADKLPVGKDGDSSYHSNNSEYWVNPPELPDADNSFPQIFRLPHGKSSQGTLVNDFKQPGRSKSVQNPTGTTSPSTSSQGGVYRNLQKKSTRNTPYASSSRHVASNSGNDIPGDGIPLSRRDSFNDLVKKTLLFRKDEQRSIDKNPKILKYFHKGVTDLNTREKDPIDPGKAETAFRKQAKKGLRGFTGKAVQIKQAFPTPKNIDDAIRQAIAIGRKRKVKHGGPTSQEIFDERLKLLSSQQVVNTESAKERYNSVIQNIPKSHGKVKIGEWYSKFFEPYETIEKREKTPEYTLQHSRSPVPLTALEQYYPTLRPRLNDIRSQTLFVERGWQPDETGRPVSPGGSRFWDGRNAHNYDNVSGQWVRSNNLIPEAERGFQGYDQNTGRPVFVHVSPNGRMVGYYDYPQLQGG